MTIYLPSFSSLLHRIFSRYTLSLSLSVHIATASSRTVPSEAQEDPGRMFLHSRPYVSHVHVRCPAFY